MRIVDIIATALGIVVQSAVSLLAGFTVAFHGASSPDSIPEGVRGVALLIILLSWLASLILPAMVDSWPRFVYPLGATVMVVFLTLTLTAIWPDR